jgi:hypothetical protein
MDKLEHGENPAEQGTLTNWRVQTDRQVRTQKESDQVRGTHSLESTDGQTSQESQDTERIQPKGTHFLKNAYGQTSQDTERSEQARGTHQLESTDRWTEMSGHGKNSSEKGPLTS